MLSLRSDAVPGSICFMVPVCVMFWRETERVFKAMALGKQTKDHNELTMVEMPVPNVSPSSLDYGDTHTE
jgi:hypothetical protein